MMKDDKLIISIMIEWKVIQERFIDAGANLKLYIKEQSRKISYTETTYLKQPSEPIKTKGVPKKVTPTESDNPTKWYPSYIEQVESHFLDSPNPKSIKKNQGCLH